jgi:hypothetical protein
MATLIEEPIEQGATLIDNTNPPVSIPTEVATQRAVKAHLGMQDRSPGVDVLRSAMLMSDEHKYRDQEAGYQNGVNRSLQQDMLMDMAKKYGGQVPQPYDTIADSLLQYKSNVDPETVFESNYSHWLVNTWMGEKAQEEGNLREGLFKHQALVADVADMTETTTTRTEGVRRLLENKQAEASKQGWGAYLGHMVTDMVPFVSWYRNFNLIKPASSKWLPGENMAEQIDYALSLPPSEAIRVLKNATNEMNVQDAVPFLQAILGQGLGRQGRNVMGLLDLTSITPFGRIGKAVGVDPYRKSIGITIVDPQGLRPVPLESARKGVDEILDKALREGTYARDLRPEELSRAKEAAYNLVQDTNILDLINKNVLVTKAKGGVDTFIQDDNIRKLIDHAIQSTGKHTPMQMDKMRRAVGDIIQDDNIRTLIDKNVQESFVGGVQRAFAAIGETALSPKLFVESMLSDTGLIRQAIKVGVDKKLAQIEKGEPTFDIKSDLPTLMNPSGVITPMSAAGRNNIVDFITKIRDEGEKLLGQLGRANRTTREANNVGIAESEHRLDQRFIHLNDSFTQFAHTPAEFHPFHANVDTVSAYLGKPDKTHFETKAIAENYRAQYGLDPETAQVVEQGGSFWIKIDTPVSDVTTGVRDKMINTSNQTPTSWMSLLFGEYNPKSADSLLSKLSNENRKIVADAPQEMKRFLIDTINDSIGQLTKNERQRVARLIEHKSNEHTALGPRTGTYANDVEFEQDYLKFFNTLPEDKEVKAYFGYKALMELDLYMRNISVYRDKARQGVERHRFEVQLPKGNEKTPWIEGSQVDNIPWGLKDPFGVYIYDSTTGRGSFAYSQLSGSYKQMEQKDIKALYEKGGYKIVKVFSPLDKPLKEITTKMGEPLDEVVQYIVTNAPESAPLTFKQVRNQPGMHSEYVDRWYAKSPITYTGKNGHTHYAGDRVLGSYSSRREAQQANENLELAREMMNTNNPGLGAFVQRTLGRTEQEFRDLFTKHGFDKDAPFVAAYRNSTAKETNPELFEKLYPNLRDYTRSTVNPSSSMEQAYLANRNELLENARNVGTHANPVWQVQKARQLDPFSALNHALNQGIKGVWLNDYKHQAIESWVKEFGHLLTPKTTELEANPHFHFYKPSYVEKTMDEEGRMQLMAAKVAWNRINNFTGIQTELGRNISFIETKVQDLVYTKLGLGKADWVQDHLIPHLTDPMRAMRAIAFHSKMGFFNPAQFFVQVNAMTHAMAVADPAHSVQGAWGGIVARMAMRNDQAKTLDQWAKMSGWSNPEHWKEMYTSLKASGFRNVSGEHALRDDLWDPNLMKGTVGTVLDKGTIFFREGERIPRLSAYSIAYREWRAANPTAKLDSRFHNEILNRADTLTLNMTRASNSALNEGVFSVPLQFATYIQRAFEQMMPGYSNILKPAEKARAWGMYGMLYGVPAIPAIATLGTFGYDDIRQAAIAKGVDVNEKWFQLAHEGLISFIYTMANEKITGKERNYDFARRYGPGSNFLNDILSGDKTTVEMLFGPSGSVMKDIMKGVVAPGYMKLASVLKGEEFPTKAEDFLEPMKVISSWNLIDKVHSAMVYGKFIARNGEPVGPYDTYDAVMAVLGLTPQQITDTYMKDKVQKSWREYQTKIEREVKEELRRAYKQTDDETRDSYLKRAQTWVKQGDLNESQIKSIYQDIAKEVGDKIPRQSEQLRRNAPESLGAAHQQRHIREIERYGASQP